ncbi:MAG: pseudouridine synthase [Oleiphilaceae bacterium]|nr:pseudouridine synthase [Oleiphilaceae bacterium]
MSKEGNPKAPRQPRDNEAKTGQGRAGARKSREPRGPQAPQPERVQKVLARAGVGSRRGVETMMEEGRVLLNGQPVTPGAKVGPEDRLSVDGKPVAMDDAMQPQRRVLVYNKPEGEVTSRNDPEGRPTVFDRLPRIAGQRWIAVGRLDINTTGLLLFTTDGELANRLMHPSYEVDREYAVRIFGEVDEAMEQRLLEGVLLDDGLAKFSDLSQAGGSGTNRWYHVTLLEGRNREVRRLWESQGVKVSRLKRVRYGNIFLPSRLSMGRWEELGQAAVDNLSKRVNLTPVAMPDKTPQEAKDLRRRQNKQPSLPGRSAVAGRGRAAPATRKSDGGWDRPTGDPESPVRGTRPGKVRHGAPAGRRGAGAEKGRGVAPEKGRGGRTR